MSKFKKLVSTYWVYFLEDMKALLSIGAKDTCDNNIVFVCDRLDSTEGGCWCYNSKLELYEDYCTDRTKRPEEVV